jgi:SAM-dependent methyltransferase
LGFDILLIKPSDDEIRQIITAGTGVPESTTDEMAIPSYTHANPLIRWLMWQRLAKVIELADINENMSVLDFGCGIGLLLPSLCQTAEKVYAIDLFPQFAKPLPFSRQLKVSFIDDLNEIDDSSVDVIITADVLEHIEGLEGYIHIIARKLIKNGKLIVSGPTENLIYKLGRIAAGWGDKGDYHLTDIYAIRSIIMQYVFIQTDRRTLPFKPPPHLFHVYMFINRGQ